jgi:hypothetical protein
MRISVSTKRIEKVGHQDQKHQFAGLPDLLGTGSTTVAVRDVPGLRSAGFTESKK